MVKLYGIGNSLLPKIFLHLKYYVCDKISCVNFQTSFILTVLFKIIIYDKEYETKENKDKINWFQNL